MKNLKLFFGIAAMAAVLTTSCGPKLIEVTSIELDNATITLEIGQKQTLKATVLPEKATDPSVTWTSSADSVASVVNGVVTANGPGTATILAKAGTCTATCIVTVKGIVEINGVRWSIYNVGLRGEFVSNPEDYGEHYQWNKGTNGFLSESDYLVSSYPSATSWLSANDPCPNGWRIPTVDELASLFNTMDVSRKKTVVNGINGMLFTDVDTQKSVFLPAAGFYSIFDGAVDDAGVQGSYWSSEPAYSYNACSYYFFYDTEYVDRNDDTPMVNGQSVRCVEKSTQ